MEAEELAWMAPPPGLQIPSHLGLAPPPGLQVPPHMQRLSPPRQPAPPPPAYPIPPPPESWCKQPEEEARRREEESEEQAQHLAALAAGIAAAELDKDTAWAETREEVARKLEDEKKARLDMEKKLLELQEQMRELEFAREAEKKRLEQELAARKEDEARNKRAEVEIEEELKRKEFQENAKKAKAEADAAFNRTYEEELAKAKKKAKEEAERKAKEVERQRLLEQAKNEARQKAILKADAEKRAKEEEAAKAKKEAKQKLKDEQEKKAKEKDGKQKLKDGQETKAKEKIEKKSKGKTTRKNDKKKLTTAKQGEGDSSAESELEVEQPPPRSWQQPGIDLGMWLDWRMIPWNLPWWPVFVVFVVMVAWHAKISQEFSTPEVSKLTDTFPSSKADGARKLKKNTPKETTFVQKEPDPDEVAKLRLLTRGVYERRNPAKLDELDALFKRYRGRERQVYEHACRKYGEVPVQTHNVTYEEIWRSLSTSQPPSNDQKKSKLSNQQKFLFREIELANRVMNKLSHDGSKIHDALGVLKKKRETLLNARQEGRKFGDEAKLRAAQSALDENKDQIDISIEAFKEVANKSNMMQRRLCELEVVFGKTFKLEESEGFETFFPERTARLGEVPQMIIDNPALAILYRRTNLTTKYRSSLYIVKNNTINNSFWTEFELLVPLDASVNDTELSVDFQYYVAEIGRLGEEHCPSVYFCSWMSIDTVRSSWKMTTIKGVRNAKVKIVVSERANRTDSAPKFLPLAQYVPEALVNDVAVVVGGNYPPRLGRMEPESLPGKENASLATSEAESVKSFSFSPAHKGSNDTGVMQREILGQVERERLAKSIPEAVAFLKEDEERIEKIVEMIGTAVAGVMEDQQNNSTFVTRKELQLAHASMEEIYNEGKQAYDRIMSLRMQHDRLLLERLQRERGVTENDQKHMVKVEWALKASRKHLLAGDQKLKMLLERFGRVKNLACTLKAQLNGNLNIELHEDDNQKGFQALKSGTIGADDLGYYLKNGSASGDMKMYIPLADHITHRDVHVEWTSMLSFQIGLTGTEQIPLLLVCSWAPFVSTKSSWAIDDDEGTRCLIVSFAVDLSNPVIVAD